MKALHRCMLVLTLLLLICQVAVSQICKSLINMVDGFHTLFLLLHMALPLPQPSPLSAHLSTSPSPPCHLSYTHLRIQTVGALISALLLASLCVSYCMEILGHALQPYPIQHPLLATMVGAVSLLHNLLVLGLSWRGLQGNRAGEVETRSHLEVNRRVMAEEQTNDHTEQGCVVDEVPCAVDGSFHNGTLVLCNPGTSSVPDSDFQAQTQKPSPQTQKPPLPGGHLHTSVPQRCSSRPGYKVQIFCVDSAGLSSDSPACEVPSSTTDMKAYQCDAYSNGYFTDMSKGSACMGRLDNQIAPKTVFESDQFVESFVPRAQWPRGLPTLVLVLQTLLSSILALTNGVVLLLISPDCLHSSESCSLLVYLDPGLSLVAVMVLLAIAVPQVYRYGLLLLQATPPQVCVSDLGRRITSVPGVQALHDLHIWQLTDTCMVASVHVHCQAGFQTHRCGDLTSGVTKVLQSIGVSCCTVQPEFLPSCESTDSSLDDISSSPPILHREAPYLPPLLACSLACGKDCARKMCCSPPVGETREPLAPSAGETEEEPHMLVIENTFL
ncbi:proton-coupled zinc antiporter SLC30A1 [Diretmus argenteus]